MIARSDAAGLRRAVMSARQQVDQVVIGVDLRSDEDTHAAAKALADVYWTFDAEAIGLSEDDWAADRIHFANARNLGRARVTAPWVLVLDTDERLVSPEDLRALVQRQPEEVDGIAIRVQTGSVSQLDPQRLARAHCRWESGTHNQLAIGPKVVQARGLIEHDTDLRAPAEVERRTAQRTAAMKAMEADAEKGDVSALYHVAKQAAHGNDVEAAVKWVTKYRSGAEVHGPVAADRAHLAFLVAVLYFERKNFAEAELWALRALLDGPQIAPLCLLGDMADMLGAPRTALVWFEGACVTPEGPHSIPETIEWRFKRREELRRG